MGVAAAAVAGTTIDTDAESGLSMGVAGDITPPGPPATPIAIPVANAVPATVVPTVATAAAPTPDVEVAATAVASFGLDFFFDPAAAAAMAALLGRITCPSGPSFACAGLG
jgi:hypothetical protein